MTHIRIETRKARIAGAKRIVTDERVLVIDGNQQIDISPIVRGYRTNVDYGKARTLELTILGYELEQVDQ